MIHVGMDDDERNEGILISDLKSKEKLIHQGVFVSFSSFYSFLLIVRFYAHGVRLLRWDWTQAG